MRYYYVLQLIAIIVGAVTAILPPRKMNAEATQAKFELAQNQKQDLLDPAGNPNLAARFELTSNGSVPLFCGKPGDTFRSGYVHFTNNEGAEDKHMFWWLFEARQDPENSPVILTFNGGPGIAGLYAPFNGIGPCSVSHGEYLNETTPSQYSWTEHANLLAIDHPVGVGFSYGEHLRNSSASASWDIDDFLQSFWKQYPHLAKNKFMINSGSYGGTFVPHLIDVIYRRNVEAKKLHSASLRNHHRVVKMPESIFVYNVWSDTMTYFRWFHESNCNKDADGNMFFNDTVCDQVVKDTPICLDAIQLAYEQPLLNNKLKAHELCLPIMGFDATVGRNLYDFRQQCSPEECSLNFTVFENLMNSPKVKKDLGVPENVAFITYNTTMAEDFEMNGDLIQPAYRLLASAIDAGLRILVYNGMADGVAPWRCNLSWMKLLKTKHQSNFINAPELEYSDFGTIKKAGDGAGDFTFVKIREAGHVVSLSQPKLVQHLMIQWINNEPFH